VDITHFDSCPTVQGPRALESTESPRLVMQSKGTKICGPCCVAMALNISVHKALELMGSKGGGTKTRQLNNALGMFYCTTGGLRTVTKYGPQFPERGIMKIVHNPKESHWVLKWNDFIYDPSWGAFYYKNWYTSVNTHTTSKVTSYLELKNKSYDDR